MLHFSHHTFSVNKKDLQDSTFVGLTWENPILDPLVVLHCDNQLYVMIDMPLLYSGDTNTGLLLHLDS